VSAADPGARRAEIADGLRRARERLDAAARAAGRDPAEIALLPVTKFFPVSDVEILYGLGCRAFGESREQEAAAKVAEFRSRTTDPAVAWHMIGRLQRNKARAVARWAHTVHSVDSVRLAHALDAGAQAAQESGDRETPVRVLLQVSLDDDPQRGGVSAADLPALADEVAAAGGLELRGLMAVPPLGWDPDAAFERLAGLHSGLRSDHPEATELSAGMSGDLEAAVRWGSTCVRVGTAVLGSRPLA
jgi:pyridoxal phosphate enzyme (YggS family)